MATYGGLDGWHYEPSGPGAETLSARGRLGDAAFTAGIQAGVVAKGTGEWLVNSEKNAFLWKVWPCHYDFVTWQGSNELPQLHARYNFYEPVGAISRLVFQVTDQSSHPLKDSFFRFIISNVLPKVEQALVAIGATDTGAREVEAWRFTDASAPNVHSFRAYSQTIKMTERARHALLATLPDVGLVSKVDADQCGLPRREQTLQRFEFDFSSFAFTGRPVLMPKCVDSRSRYAGNDPVSTHMVQRMVHGEKLTYADFASSGGFYADGLQQPLCLEELRCYSLDARFVLGEALDITGAPGAPAPLWLSSAIADYTTLGYGPVAVGHLVGDVIVYPEGHSIATVKVAGARCPGGIVHEQPTMLVFRLEADGCVSAECCGRQRGNTKDLHVLGKDNKRTGETRSRGGTEDTCSKVTLQQSKLMDTFLKAETLDALPSGRLPPFTRAAREAVRERFGKLGARMFILTHVCGSGKSLDMIIPAVVEHVLEAERKETYWHEHKLFVVLAAPTRKLVGALMDDVDAALKAVGAKTRCKHYLDGDFDPTTRGLIATCTHSLGKLGRNGKIQLLVNDEVDEGIASVTQLNPDCLFDVLATCNEAEEVIWADAMAGCVIKDALAHLRVPEKAFVVLDTPSLRPFRGAPTHLIVPATARGSVVENAAIAEAIKQCKSGRTVLFCSPTVFEVRVLEAVAKAEGIACTVAHSKMGETVTFVNNLKHCRRTESLCAEADDRLTSHQLYAMSPIVSSGVSSRGLFDVVVASVKGCTINAKIMMQMVERARDPNTEVKLIVTDKSLLQSPAGSWVHERIDFAAAAMDVQNHCRARALADVTSIGDAERRLKLADLQKAFGDGRGLVRVGIAPATTQEVPVDDEAFYAHVPERRGSARGAMLWFRFARKPTKGGSTIEDVIKENARKDRMSLAAREADAIGARRIGALLSRLEDMPYDLSSSLQRVAAHAGLELKTRQRDYLRTLSAIVEREERAYEGPKLEMYSDEEVVRLGHIKAARIKLKEDDLTDYVRYEVKALRPLDGTGDYASKLERYQAMESLFLDHASLSRHLAGLKQAKRMRLEDHAVDDAAAEYIEDHLDDVEEEEEEDVAVEEEEADQSWRDCIVLGDAPRTAWEEYLTYGPEFVAERNDRYMQLYEEKLAALAADLPVDEDVDKELKDLKSLTAAMTKKSTQEAFRCLYRMKHENLEELHVSLIDRFREMKTSRTDTQLVKWLAVHDLLLVAGWSRGVFDESSDVRSLLTPKNGAWWNDPAHAEERRRSEAVTDKYRAIGTCTGYNLSISLFDKAIARNIDMTSHMRLNIVSTSPGRRTEEQQWVVKRTGKVWEYLGKCTQSPEWTSFFSKHRRDRKGYYTASQGQPPVEVRI